LIAHAALGIASLALNAQRAFVGKLKDDFTLAPNLYIMGIAEPGEGKTPTISILRKPLDAWAEQSTPEYCKQLANYRASLKSLAATRKKIDSAMQKHGDSKELCEQLVEIE